MIRRLRFFIITLALSPGLARAADVSAMVQVVSVSRTNSALVRFRNDTDNFPKGEGVCFLRVSRVIACGHIDFSDRSGVNVQLTHGTNKFRPNESLRMRAEPQYARSDLRGFETFNIETGGTFIGPSGFYLYPFLHFQYAITKKIAIGILPFFTTQDSGNLSALGAFATAQYYFGDNIWRGFYIGLGLGGASIKGSKVPDDKPNVTLKDSVFSFAVHGIGGYRYIIADTFHIGGSFGLQYLSKTSGATLDFGFPSISPQATLEFGYLF